MVSNIQVITASAEPSVGLSQRGKTPLREILDAHRDHTSPKHSEKTAAFIARGISKIYQMGDVKVHALTSVDLELYDGELVVLRSGGARRYRFFLPRHCAPLERVVWINRGAIDIRLLRSQA